MYLIYVYTLKQTKSCCLLTFYMIVIVGSSFSQDAFEWSKSIFIVLHFWLLHQLKLGQSEHIDDLDYILEKHGSSISYIYGHDAPTTYYSVGVIIANNIILSGFMNERCYNICRVNVGARYWEHYEIIKVKMKRYNNLNDNELMAPQLSIIQVDQHLRYNKSISSLPLANSPFHPGEVCALFAWAEYKKLSKPNNKDRTRKIFEVKILDECGSGTFCFDLNNPDDKLDFCDVRNAPIVCHGELTGIVHYGGRAKCRRQLKATSVHHFIEWIKTYLNNFKTDVHNSKSTKQIKDPSKHINDLDYVLEKHGSSISYIFGYDAPYTYYWVGAIIAENVILAGYINKHCYKICSVNVGNKEWEGNDVVKMKIKKYSNLNENEFVAPQLCIIQTDQNLTYSKSVSPLPLPSSPFRTGEVCALFTWGEYENLSNPVIVGKPLKIFEVKILDECGAGTFCFELNNPDDKLDFCDVRNAPIVCHEELTGIVFFGGPEICREQLKATSVHHFTEWIKTNLNKLNSLDLPLELDEYLFEEDTKEFVMKDSSHFNKFSTNELTLYIIYLIICVFLIR